MAHELDFKANGEGAAFFVGEPAWHRLGTVLTEAPSLEEALILAGLDFEVEKVPHYIKRKIAGQPGPPKLIESGDGWSVVRKDRWEVVGTVGSEWQPLQNSEAFGVIEPALDDGLAVIETGGALRGGKDVWMLVKLQAEEIKRRAMDSLPDDADRKAMERMLDEMLVEIATYALFTNRHDVGRKAMAVETPIRVVCANTLRAALNGQNFSVAVDHRGDVATNYQTACDLLFQELTGRYLRFAEFRDLLKATTLDFPEFKEMVLDPAVPVAHLERKIQRHEGNKFTEVSLEKASVKRAEITRLWDEGEGHTGDRSSWEAYNALTQWTDHGDSVAPGRDRLQSMYDGVIARVKRRVATSLFAHARAVLD